jgi:hypothetical protein
MKAIDYLHHTPGRLRIKGRHINCRGPQARRAILALQSMKGIEQVTLNPHAGSLTVHYDPALYSQADLLAALESSGCMRLTEAASTLTHPSPTRRAAAGEGVAGTFGKALVGVLAQRTATRLIGVLL